MRKIIKDSKVRTFCVKNSSSSEIALFQLFISKTIVEYKPKFLYIVSIISAKKNLKLSKIPNCLLSTIYLIQRQGPDFRKSFLYKKIDVINNRGPCKRHINLLIGSQRSFLFESFCLFVFSGTLEVWGDLYMIFYKK